MDKIGDINTSYPGGPAMLVDGGRWEICDGRLLSRKTNPETYALIGMTYADEDKRCCNAELFPLPDLIERAEDRTCRDCGRIMSERERCDQGRVCNDCTTRNMGITSKERL